MITAQRQQTSARYGVAVHYSNHRPRESRNTLQSRGQRGKDFLQVLSCSTVQIDEVQSGTEESAMTRKDHAVKVCTLFGLLCDPLQERRVHGVRLVIAHFHQFDSVPYFSFDHRSLPFNFLVNVDDLPSEEGRLTAFSLDTISRYFLSVRI